MAIPAAAFVWSRVLDPSDIADYVLDLTQMVDLANGEDVDTWALVLAPEAVALGLQVGTVEYDITELSPGVFRIYFMVDPAFADNPAYDALQRLPMTVTINTTAAPPRKWQRTLVLQVTQL